MGSGLLSASQRGCRTWSGVGFLLRSSPGAGAARALGSAKLPPRSPWFGFARPKRVPGLHPPPCWAEEEADAPGASAGSPEAWGGGRVWFWRGDIALQHRPGGYSPPRRPFRAPLALSCSFSPFLLLQPFPAPSALPRSFGTVSGPERHIPYIIHAATSPGGWVTARAQPPAPRCPTRGVPQEAGGSSQRAAPRLPSRRPSAMPSEGLLAAEGATERHAPRRNRAQVNTPPGQGAGLGAGRCAGSCLVPAPGIDSQGPSGAGA